MYLQFLHSNVLRAERLAIPYMLEDADLLKADILLMFVLPQVGHLGMLVDIFREIQFTEFGSTNFSDVSVCRNAMYMSVCLT